MVSYVILRIHQTQGSGYIRLKVRATGIRAGCIESMSSAVSAMSKRVAASAGDAVQRKSPSHGMLWTGTEAGEYELATDRALKVSRR